MAFKYEDIGDLSYVKKITLDTSGGTSRRFIEAKQNDKKSRYLEITITNNDVFYSVPAGITARVRGTKPDGKSFLNDGDVHNGLVYVELTEQMLAAVGRAQCDVSLYKGNSLLSTVTFFIEINSAPYDENKVVSTDDFSALNDALARVENVGAVADEALSNSQEALDNLEELNQAETARAAAETTRQANETQRQQNETQRQTFYSGFQKSLSDNEIATELLLNDHRQLKWKVDDSLTIDVGTITLTNTLLFPFNDSTKSVALSVNRLNTDYIVQADIISANGNVGEISISDKLVNGFKIGYTGSAKTVTVKYIVTGGFAQ